MKKIKFINLILALLIFMLPIMSGTKVQALETNISTIRLSGDDRYATMKSISENFASGKVDNVIITSGENFPDALSSAILSKKYSAPILLVSNTDYSDALDYVNNHLNAGGHVYILGGTGVVPSALETKLKNCNYSVLRLGGADRFQTNVKIVENANIPMNTPIILANADNFPDALSASSVSGIKNYPIILTSKNSLNSTNTQQIKNIAPSKVYIVGGTGAVSDAVKNSVQAITGLTNENVVRLWGMDRYETSLNIAKEFNLVTDTAVIAYGENFPDALSGTALAIKRNAPIILTNGYDITKQKSYMLSKGYTKAIILGGYGVISKTLQDFLALPSTSNIGNIKIHYIDVGQADSILIQQGSSAMLIDGGNNADSTLVKDYIANQGITSLNYVIGTHTHEDHIGGLDYVINSFRVGKVYFPKKTATTITFQDFANAVINNNLGLTVPQVGETFSLGNATCTMLAPNSSSYTDDNDYSIVVKVKFGNNSFLFTGDAQAVSEMEMVNKGLDLKADVLKVGHHGSYTSTCSNFLSKVNPQYAVISVGANNSYGHPAQATIDRLNASNVSVYRTDLNGTIVASSDGNNITFTTQK